jgi:hypothetical protein
MKPIISRNLTPLPPFPPSPLPYLSLTLSYKEREAEKLLLLEWGFQSLSPMRGEVWRGVYLYIKNFSNIL